MADPDVPKTELTKAQSALASTQVVSIVQRGLEDLLRLEGAERWYQEGESEWAKERASQEHWRFLCPWDELPRLDEEEYKAGFECFQRGIALNPSHAGIQNRLGDAYYFGMGVAQNHVEAAAWFRRAADQGIAAAQYSLGWLCEHGQGVTQNYDAAVSWYRKAAEQGLGAAAFELAGLLEIGQGIHQDYTEAAKWYRLAAEWGDERAHQALEDMLRKKRDPKAAMPTFMQEP